ncbi:hypothetical protein M8J77_005387 [Diaphorina citri]|nr:hypothetical protein M8J77_005387 [Diaphorina citri]
MVLFRNGNESPLGVPKRDQTVPKLLRVSPLRHSFRVVSLGARYDSTAESSDNDSTLSSPSYVDDDEDKDQISDINRFSANWFVSTWSNLKVQPPEILIIDMTIADLAARAAT